MVVQPNIVPGTQASDDLSNIPGVGKVVSTGSSFQLS